MLTSDCHVHSRYLWIESTSNKRLYDGTAYQVDTKRELDSFHGHFFLEAVAVTLATLGAFLKFHWSVFLVGTLKADVRGGR